MSRALAALVLAAALASGCGGDDEEPAVQSPPPATATPTVAPEDRPGGAGDEEEVRVPVELTVSEDGALSPRQVSVPAFLALELIVRNESSSELEVTLEGAEPLAVPAAGTARTELPGRRPGEYAIDAGAAGEALLITGAEPGP